MILPHNIDIAQSQKYYLSIRLTPNGFSFSIFSPADASVFFFKEVDFNNNLSVMENVKKIFFEVNLFSQPYRKIFITMVSPHFTLVPEHFFDAKNREDYFKFNFNFNLEKKQVLSCQPRKSDCHIVYNLDSELHAFLYRNLWNPVFLPFTTHLIPFFKDYRNEVEAKRCFVDFHDSMVTIVCFDRDRLLSAHTFHTGDTHDTLFGIVNIWEKQPLDQNSDILFLSGDISGNKMSIDILRQLIRNVEEVDIASKIPLNNFDKTLPTDILLQLCV